MTHTIAPPTLEELNERIAFFESNKKRWRKMPSIRVFEIELYCLYAVRDVTLATYKIARWLSAALEDPAVCPEMKSDIEFWFDAQGKTPNTIIQSPWMDIETAPKDGTEILGVFFRPRDEDFSPVLSGPWTTCFKDGKWRSSWDGEEVLEYMGDLGSEYKSPLYNPSHWMPLPAPPTQNSIMEEQRCQKCGCATKQEEALVNGQIWCHPCADKAPPIPKDNK